MVRPENLRSKLAALRRYVGLLETFRARSLDEIRADAYLRGALERYLFLAVQATIDLSEMLCALKELERPASMSRGFSILEAAGILPPDLSLSLQRMVGFRNALVHGYENLDYSIIEDVPRVRLGELEDFGRIVENAL